MRCLAILSVALLTACNRGDGAPLRRADGSLLSEAGGEVSLSDGSRLQFVITSERYKQWETARAGLSKNVVARFGALLKPKSPTQESIAKATAFLASDPQAKQAIERTGMSVNDFVLMTVALEQEMQLASGRGQAPAAATPEPYPVDTSYELPTVPPAQIPVQSVPPPPVVYDSTVHPDSMTPPIRRDSMIRRDSVRVDTTTPKRDTVSPPVRDSILPNKPLTDSIGQA